MNNFQVECMQQPNPHLSYLKITPLLKISVIILMKQVEKCVQMKDKAFTTDDSHLDFVQLAENVKVYLSCIKDLQKVVLLYVEARLIDKFESEFLLKCDFCSPLLRFLELMIMYASVQLNSLVHMNHLEIVLDSMSQILEENILRIEFNVNNIYQPVHVQLIELCYQFAELLLENSNVGSKYQHPKVFQVSLTFFKLLTKI